MAEGRYEFNYDKNGPYGRAVALTVAHRRPGVHLDLGCGFGAIAEPLRDAGVEYVGADCDPEGLASLAARGFGTVPIDLTNIAECEAAIRDALAGRPIGSISLLDVLEHLAVGDDLLEMLRRMGDGTSAPLIISVPNVTHRDLGAKLVLARWDYTPTGLLDRTHLVHHTQEYLSDRLSASGWGCVETRDFDLVDSDQHFPDGLPTLNRSTSVGAFLSTLRETAAPHAVTNQFVRAYQPVVVPTSPDRESSSERRPMFSVIMRTQGKRLAALREALLCLRGQTIQDFEIRLMVHRPSEDATEGLLDLLHELPAELAERVHLTLVTDGGRSRPLNQGLECARGQYVVCLDDDDLVLAHWLETFQALASERPGSVLRAGAVSQTARPVTSPRGVESHWMSGPVVLEFPEEFEIIDHLHRNYTPLMAWAFPRTAHTDLGLRFDEDLHLCEDWDFALRALQYCGVAASPEITSIYRRWEGAENSATLHQAHEWDEVRRSILDRMDAGPLLLPAGTLGSLDRQLYGRVAELDGYATKLERNLAESRGYATTLEGHLEESRRYAAKLETDIAELKRSVAPPGSLTTVVPIIESAVERSVPRAYTFARRSARLIRHVARRLKR